MRVTGSAADTVSIITSIEIESTQAFATTATCSDETDVINSNWRNRVM